MNERLNKLAPLISAVQLGTIVLREGFCKAGAALPEGVTDLDFKVSWTAKASAPRESGFDVRIAFDATISPHGEIAFAPTELKADFQIAYVISGGYRASKAELEEFANLNGVFNAWPYWREFLQSSMTRMGLAPLMLPLYRIGTSGVSTKLEAGADVRRTPRPRSRKTPIKR